MTSARRIRLAAVLSVSLAVATAPAAFAASTAKTPESLVPKGYNVEQRLNVDLDKDGDKDAVLVGGQGVVPVPEENADTDGDGERVLVVVRKDKVGWTRIGLGSSALMCRRCGGAFWGVVPAPIELSTSGNVIVVGQEAGAREMTSWTHRYRVEKNRVRLIGRDEVNLDRSSAGVVTFSENYLTGTIVVTREGDVDPANPDKAGTRKVAKKTIWLEQVGFADRF